MNTKEHKNPANPYNIVHNKYIHSTFNISGLKSKAKLARIKNEPQLKDNNLLKGKSLPAKAHS